MAVRLVLFSSLVSEQLNRSSYDIPFLCEDKCAGKATILSKNKASQTNPATMLRSLLSRGGLIRNDHYIFPSVDPTQDGPDCKQDCADCTVQFPSKVKVETSRPLYGHIKEFHTHVLVATGKSDWTEHVENEKGSLMEAFDASSNQSKHGVCSDPVFSISQVR